MTNLENAKKELRFLRFSKLWYDWKSDTNPSLLKNLLSMGTEHLQEKLNDVQKQAIEYYQDVYDQLEKHRASEKSTDYLKNLQLCNEIQGQAFEFTLEFIYGL